MVLSGLFGCDFELSQVQCLIFFSSIARMDFQLILKIRLFILNWSFIMDCRYFLLVMKLQYVSAFPPITSHWVFYCFLTMPCTFLPPCLFSSHSLFLVHPPSLIAVWKPSHSSVLFTKCLKKKKHLCFQLNVNILVFIKAKSPPLFLSNLCLLCTLLFNCAYLQYRDTVLLM